MSACLVRTGAVRGVWFWGLEKGLFNSAPWTGSLMSSSKRCVFFHLPNTVLCLLGLHGWVGGSTTSTIMVVCQATYLPRDI